MSGGPATIMMTQSAWPIDNESGLFNSNAPAPFANGLCLYYASIAPPPRSPGFFKKSAHFQGQAQCAAYNNDTTRVSEGWPCTTALYSAADRQALPPQPTWADICILRCSSTLEPAEQPGIRRHIIPSNSRP